MNLDSLLSNRIKQLNKKYPSTRRKKKKPEQIHRDNMNQLIRLLTTGDFNMEKRSHCILFRTGVKHGYVDKETHEILKYPEGGRRKNVR